MTEPFDINKTGRVIMPEINESPCCTPSDLELRIRREVIQALDQIMSYEWFNLDSTLTRARFIKDRLNLMWGSNE